MNRKSRTVACRSPVQTRPRLLREYRAPAAAACSHAAAGSTHHARLPSGQQAPPPGLPHFCQPARPTREWSGRSVQTRGQDRRDSAQHGRAQPSVGETLANRVGVFLASAAPLAKSFRVSTKPGQPQRRRRPCSNTSKSSTIGSVCIRPSAIAPRPRRGPAWKGSPCVQPHDALISLLHSTGGSPMFGKRNLPAPLDPKTRTPTVLSQEQPKNTGGIVETWVTGFQTR